MQTNKTHKSHNMRYSDSSQYDFICDSCREPDWCNRTNPNLVEPCKENKDADQ